MRNIKESITEIIGHTPLLHTSRLNSLYGADAEILVKIEGMNPGGSAKDRPALKMIEEAEKEGRLKPGGTIIEPTSGNTGVGLAMVTASRGYRAVMVMPDTMSIERRKLLKAYGAEIVLTPGSEGMAGSVSMAEKLHSENENSIIAGQFVNPANYIAHMETTGPEIWEDTDGTVDVFVAGMGTGGTVTGTGKYLKKMNPDVHIVMVEPADSPLVSEGKSGPHGLQGIGANFIPDVFDRSVCDEVITVSDDDAFDAMRKLAQVEGVFAGITSGAAYWAAVQISKREEYRGKTVVALLPDTGERYLSVI